MPWYLQAVLEYVKQFYGNPPVYIYENGFSLSLSLSHTHTHKLKQCSFNSEAPFCFLLFLLEVDIK
jgi:hypothetical protein